ncbi:type II secretion system secretin GspD [Exilibacterium tricleocarpae]|uniref:type II secretion system secretin GspD n=1 Tax=Exilibacterium tricleocarpae TaxID=2591008 RepID=UPI003CCC6DD0
MLNTTFAGGLKRLLLSACLVSFCAGAQEQTWTVNFNDSDIGEVIKFVADASGRTIIIDPRVKGRVKVISAEPLSGDQLYDLFLSILDVHGFTAIPRGNVVRIIPSKDGRTEGGVVRPGQTTRVTKPKPAPNQAAALSNNEHVTEVIQLDNVTAVKVLPVLRPLVPQHAHLAAYDNSNAIIVSDTIANIRRIKDIIERLDRAAVAKTEVIALKHAQAEEIVRILKELENKDAGKGAATSKLVLVADKRINGVVVSGDDLQRQRARDLISQLDQPQQQAGNVRVVYLEYADAEQVAEVLGKVMQSLGKVGPGGDKAGSAAGNATVEADPETNALLITADVDVLPTLLAVVEKLDIRRAQVLVEAIIVELEGGEDNALGVQWLFQGDSNGIGSSSLGDGLLGNIAAGILGTEVTRRFDPDTGRLIEEIRSDNDAELGGALAGNRGQIFGVGRQNDNGSSFLFLLNALEQQTGSNILSTPNLLTMDNHEATITVGQNVPFVTGSFSNTGGGASNPQNPFQTIERQNVGITLKVTPKVNEGDSVVLDIVQEVSSLSGATVQASDVITNERKVETQVMAKDGEIVVLGGLIQDNVQESEQRVPFLGSIPGLGRLFRSDATTVSKTNLLIFIRPTVIRNAEELTGATAEKYRYIRERQILQRERGEVKVDESLLPLLPEWPEGASQPVREPADTTPVTGDESQNSESQNNEPQDN